MSIPRSFYLQPLMAAICHQRADAETNPSLLSGHLHLSHRCE